MTITRQITMVNHDDLVNILSGATYGSDWLGGCTKKEFGAILPPNLEKIKEKFEEEHGTYCMEDKWADILLNGGTLVMVDYYDEDEDGEEGKCYPITLTDLLNGLTKYYNEYPKSMQSILDEEGDYYDFNNALQMVMFGEVVYG